MDPFHEGLAAAFPQIRQVLSRLLDPVELESIDGGCGTAVFLLGCSEAVSAV